MTLDSVDMHIVGHVYPSRTSHYCLACRKIMRRWWLRHLDPAAPDYAEWAVKGGW